MLLGRKEDRTVVQILAEISTTVLLLFLMAETPTAPERVDGRRVRGDNTRRAILGRAMQIASSEGLEDLSLARLAADLGMSKSGLFAHFGSKEELQLSTLRAARAVFSQRAVAPAMDVPEGIARLHALMSTWLSEYVGGDAFEGGCLFMEAAAEFDNRPGPVRDLVAETMGMWLELLESQARIALANGELAKGTDPYGLAWELHAFGLGLNWERQLMGRVGERAGAALEGRLRAAATAKGRRRLA
jgi:AcrR family transcriptional regulator